MKPATVSETGLRGACRRWPAVCSECMESVDLAAILPVVRRGIRIVHECGKVLHRGAAA